MKFLCNRYQLGATHGERNTDTSSPTAPIQDNSTDTTMSCLCRSVGLPFRDIGAGKNISRKIFLWAVISAPRHGERKDDTTLHGERNNDTTPQRERERERESERMTQPLTTSAPGGLCLICNDQRTTCGITKTILIHSWPIFSASRLGHHAPVRFSVQESESLAHSIAGTL